MLLSRSDNYRVRFHYIVLLRYQHIVVARVILFSDFIVKLHRITCRLLDDIIIAPYHLPSLSILPYRTSPFIILFTRIKHICFPITASAKLHPLELSRIRSANYILQLVSGHKYILVDIKDFLERVVGYMYNIGHWRAMGYMLIFCMFLFLNA